MKKRLFLPLIHHKSPPLDESREVQRNRVGWWGAPRIVEPVIWIAVFGKRRASDAISLFNKPKQVDKQDRSSMILGLQEGLRSEGRNMGENYILAGLRKAPNL